MGPGFASGKHMVAIQVIISAYLGSHQVALAVNRRLRGIVARLLHVVTVVNPVTGPFALNHWEVEEHHLERVVELAGGQGRSDSSCC